MANQPEVSIWEPVYQIETTDTVEGGVGGKSNQSLLNLANRTLWLKDNVWRTGDIKEVDCSNAYITANFDGTGLGINERLGWAICNGNNGTKNRNGRVGLAYGSSYSSMGATGGAERVVLTNAETPYWKTNLNIGPGSTTAADWVDDGNGTTTAQSHNNMQPYIVSLFIMKL